MTMTYEKACKLLTGRCKNSRKLQNNTYLERVDENTVAIRLHRTRVVTIGSDGIYTLKMGGWSTSTSKERINNYSPIRIWSWRGSFYFGGWFRLERKDFPCYKDWIQARKDWRMTHEFEDGMQFDARGKCLKDPAQLLAERKARDEQLNKERTEADERRRIRQAEAEKYDRLMRLETGIEFDELKEVLNG